MKEQIAKLVAKENLSQDEAYQIMSQIAFGKISEIEIAGFLTALSAKGETKEEISGMVQALREQMIKVETDYDTLDTCGTGGDNAGTINVSTMAAFVCAADGVKVAKHGNRSVSSRCGSFDVLEILGVRIDLSAREVKQCLDQVGIGCMFAPSFHPAMKQVVPVRKTLGIRTVFNFMGPLLNPASARYQLIGVSSKALAEQLGEILIALGSKHVLCVVSDDGLDEISISAPTYIYEFTPGEPTKKYLIKPTVEFSLSEVKGGSPEENAEIMKAILAGNGSYAQNQFVSINAGAALYVAGKAQSIEAGAVRAQNILQSGAGLAKLEELVAFTKNL